MLPTAASLAQKGFQSIKLPKNPTAPGKGLGVVALQHGIPLFPAHLAEYITRIEIQKAAKPRHYPSAARLPFSRINVYHSFRLGLEGLHDDSLEEDWVKASPVSGGRFDTVVVLLDEDADAVSLHGEFVVETYRTRLTSLIRDEDRSRSCYLHPTLNNACW